VSVLLPLLLLLLEHMEHMVHIPLQVGLIPAMAVGRTMRRATALSAGPVPGSAEKMASSTSASKIKRRMRLTEPPSYWGFSGGYRALGNRYHGGAGVWRLAGRNAPGLRGRTGWKLCSQLGTNDVRL
jgi:hypothetical protein